MKAIGREIDFVGKNDAPKSGYIVYLSLLYGIFENKRWLADFCEKFLWLTSPVLIYI